MTKIGIILSSMPTTANRIHRIGRGTPKALSRFQMLRSGDAAARTRSDRLGPLHGGRARRTGSERRGQMRDAHGFRFDLLWLADRGKNLIASKAGEILEITSRKISCLIV